MLVTQCIVGAQSVPISMLLRLRSSYLECIATAIILEVTDIEEI